MAGAALRRLQYPVEAGVGKRRAHAIGTMAMHHENLARRERPRRVDHMREQRPAGKRMKHLGKVRPHALAKTCSKYDHVERHHADSRLNMAREYWSRSLRSSPPPRRRARCCASG